MGRVLEGGYRAHEFLSGLLTSVLVLSTLIARSAEQTQCMERGAQLDSGKTSFPGTGRGLELGWGHSLPPWTSIALGMETYARFKGG